MGDDFVFQDLSAGKKEKGPDRAVSTDSKATGGEVISFECVSLVYVYCKQNLFFCSFHFALKSMKSLSFDCESSILEFGANETIGADMVHFCYGDWFSAHKK